MDRRIRLLAFASVLAASAGYLYFATPYSGMGFFTLLAAALIALEAVFPRIK